MTGQSVYVCECARTCASLELLYDSLKCVFFPDVRELGRVTDADHFLCFGGQKCDASTQPASIGLDKRATSPSIYWGF